jgi:hypothetical protein
MISAVFLVFSGPWLETLPLQLLRCALLARFQQRQKTYLDAESQK